MAEDVLDVADLDDPRIAQFRNLKDKRLAAEMGLFVAEGEHLVRRLVTSPLRMHSLLCAASRVSEIQHGVPEGVPIYAATETMLSKIVGFRFHIGMLACGYRPDAISDVSRILPANVLTVCPHLNLAENLGAIMRTSAALGVDGLLVSDRGVDPFSRRCVRVSMGAAFFLPTAQSLDLDRDLARLRGDGFQLVATVLAPDATLLEEYAPGERVAVLIGSEPDGLPAHVVAKCTHRVTIPMGRGVDSLNAAVAAGIVLHHCVSRRDSPGRSR